MDHPGSRDVARNRQGDLRAGCTCRCGDTFPIIRRRHLHTGICRALSLNIQPQDLGVHIGRHLHGSDMAGATGSSQTVCQMPVQDV